MPIGETLTLITIFAVVAYFATPYGESFIKTGVLMTMLMVCIIGVVYALTSGTYHG